MGICVRAVPLHRADRLSPREAGLESRKRVAGAEAASVWRGAGARQGLLFGRAAAVEEQAMRLPISFCVVAAVFLTALNGSAQQTRPKGGAAPRVESAA